MNRPPLITEALNGAVLFGDISPQQAREALLSGLPADRPCFPANVEGAAAAKRAGPGALLLSEVLIPQKVGAFWGPQPYAAARAARLAAKHPKGAEHAYKWGAGLRSNGAPGVLTCIAFESDSASLQAQAELLDFLDDSHGIRPNLVVMSGDTREASLQRLGFPREARAEVGKSLHTYIAINAVKPGDTDHARCLKAVCVLARADLAATDYARLLRAPGVIANRWGVCAPQRVRPGEVVRVQTVLRAEARAVDAATLADALEAACEALGLDIENGLEALQCAGLLRKQAGACEASLKAALLEAAAETEATATITPRTRELLAQAGHVPRKKRKGERLGSVGSYSTALMDRDIVVRARMPDGSEQSHPFAQWGGILARLDLGERSDGKPQGLDAWTPTDAGLRHTTGRAAGTPRVTPAGRIWHAPDGARIACHVEQITYRPTRPADPAAACPPIPQEGDSRYLQFELTPGAHILRSDTGTGKTETLIRALASAPALIVTPRVSITEEAAERYGATNYRAQSGALVVGANARSVAVCINSIARCKYTGVGAFWLVLEEAEQVVDALFGGTIPLHSEDGKTTAAKVLEELKTLAADAIESGGGVVAADAFAGDLTRELLGVILPKGVQTKEHGIGRRVNAKVRFYNGATDAAGGTIHTEASAMLAAIESDVSDGARVIIATLNASDAHAWGEILSEVRLDDGRRARVKVYTSQEETAQGREERSPLSELKDVDRYWSKKCVDVVIYSPCISAAVSFDPRDEMERFDIAALVAPHVQHGRTDLALQMLARPRHVNEIWIACPSRTTTRSVPSIEHLEREARVKWSAEASEYLAELGWPAGSFERQDNDLCALAAWAKYVHALRSADIKADLRRHFEARGAECTEEGVACAISENQALKEVKKRRKWTWGKLVVDAPRVNAAEAEWLRDDLRQRNAKGGALIPLGDEQDKIRATIESQTLRGRYGDPYLTEKLVIQDKHGGQWTKTKRLVRCGLIADGETLRAIGPQKRRAIREGQAAGASAEATKTKAALLLMRLHRGDEWTGALLAPLRGASQPARGALKKPLTREANPDALEATWDADAHDDDALADAYAQELKAHGIELELLRKTGFSVADVRGGHVKALGQALKAHGLTTTHTRQGGGERRRIYSIDLERWRGECELAAKRNAKVRGRVVENVSGGDSLQASTPPQIQLLTLKKRKVWTDARSHTGGAFLHPPLPYRPHTPHKTRATQKFSPSPLP